MSTVLQLHEPPYQTGAKALQDALQAAHLFGGKVDGKYGPKTAHAAEVAKYRLGYPTDQIHHGHEYAGATLLAYLTGKKELPAAFKKRRAERLHAPLQGDILRGKVVSAFRYLIAEEPRVHYLQSRPIPFPPPHTIPGSGLYTDCSGSITIACKWGGAPDPNGLGYSGLGYTGTMLSHLPHIAAGHAQPGDLVVFGPAPGHHVVILLERQGPAWLVGSHGQEKGPMALLLSVEATFQPSPATFLGLV